MLCALPVQLGCNSSHSIFKLAPRCTAGRVWEAVSLPEIGLLQDKLHVHPSPAPAQLNLLPRQHCRQSLQAVPTASALMGAVVAAETAWSIMDAIASSCHEH